MLEIRVARTIAVAFGMGLLTASGAAGQSALARVKVHSAGRTQVYALGGPALMVRVGQSENAGDTALRRGDPDTDIYVVQVLAYSSPELLRRAQAAVAAGAGVSVGRFSVEVRLTQAMQSIFKDRDGIVRGFSRVGGHEPTIRALINEFGPFLEAAKPRDVAVLFAVRF